MEKWRKVMWCIPPQQDAAFVAHMEQVLEIYKRPYDAKHPVVCMDEQPEQLIAQARKPVPTAPGQPTREDYEYVREGVCNVWMFIAPSGAWRDVSLTASKTSVDWARQVRRVLDDPRFSETERITLVCDNLSTYHLAALYQAFEPGEAPRIAQKLELIHTPKHGSWLNVAECELSALTHQCSGRRIAKQDTAAKEARAWSKRRNARQVGVDWQFATDGARMKLKHLYPKLKTC